MLLLRLGVELCLGFGTASSAHVIAEHAPAAHPVSSSPVSLRRSSSRTQVLLDSEATDKLLSPGESCWARCGGRAGYCDWCGAGNACCQRNRDDDPAECRMARSFIGRIYECVTPVVNNTSGYLVDLALYRGVSAESIAVNVTEQVNVLLSANGISNFTGRRNLSEIFRDPAPDEVKLLRVFRGDKEWDFFEGGSGGQAGVFDMRPLYHEMLHVDIAVYASAKNPEKAVDVTDKVNSLIVTNGIHNLTGCMTLSDTFGDPAPGHAKILRVYKGAQMLDLLDVSKTSELKAQPFSLEPIFAVYPKVDSAKYVSIDNESIAVDVTDRINQLIAIHGVRNVTGRRTLSTMFRDPAPGQPKALRVSLNGEELTLAEDEVPMGRHYDLSALFGEPYQIDEAVYESMGAGQPMHARNVTSKVNELIFANGIGDITKGLRISGIFRDRRPGDVKLLRVRRGPVWRNFVEHAAAEQGEAAGVYDLRPLFGEDIQADAKFGSPSPAAPPTPGLADEEADVIAAPAPAPLAPVAFSKTVAPVAQKPAASALAAQASSPEVRAPSSASRWTNASQGVPALPTRSFFTSASKSLSANARRANGNMAMSGRRRWTVDSAEVRSVDDELLADVTAKVNELIAKNGASNITGGHVLKSVFSTKSNATSKELWLSKDSERLRISEVGNSGPRSLFDVRPLFGEPLQIDEAMYVSLDDENKSKDVTTTVNHLIATYGIGNITGAVGLNTIFGDVALNEPKMLNVRRGDDTLHLREDGLGGPTDKVFDLRPLFSQPLETDDILLVRPDRFTILKTKASKLDHEGMDCWKGCGERGGYCSWCGVGNACCKKDWEWSPAECLGITDYKTSNHECVTPVVALESVAMYRRPSSEGHNEVLAAVNAALNATVQRSLFSKPPGPVAGSAVAPVAPQVPIETRPNSPQVFAAVFSQRSSANRRSLVRGMHQRAGLFGLATTKFVVCVEGTDDFQEPLEEEAAKHGDILFVECGEAHGSSRLGRKLFATVKHFMQMPVATQLFMKVDDDTFVCWSKFVDFARTLANANTYVDLSVSTSDALKTGIETSPSFVSFFPAAFMMGRNLVAEVIQRGLLDPLPLEDDGREPVGAWIKTLSKSGVQVNAVPLPCHVSHPMVDLNAVSSSTSRMLATAKWGNYPHLVQPGLDGRTIACLSQAEVTGDLERPIANCLAYEPEGGESVLWCTS